MKWFSRSGLVLSLVWLSGVALADEVPGQPSVPAAAGTDLAAPSVTWPCSAHRWWARAEYLLWWVKDGSVPPLVTTGPQESLGILGRPGTTVLYGGAGADLDYDTRFGGRFTAGLWFDECQSFGLEGSYFFLGQRSARFAAASTGDPLLGRPFFNILTGAEDVEQVANLTQPGLPDLLPLTGRVAVSSASRLWGAEANAVANLSRGCSYRVDLLAGFRYLALDEGLTITEQLRVPDDAPAFPGSQINLFDRFGTRNQFYGGHVGARVELRRGPWLVDLWGKLALGVTNQRGAIDGETVLAQPGVPVFTGQGGLLALPSNIGRYDRHQFAVVPEVGVDVGYQITERWRASVGYTFLFWSSVARPGDQIDRGVNPTQLPPGALAGPARPTFSFESTSFWAQGLHFGLEFRY